MEIRTHRRAVLSTGAKLAYAAPAFAVTLRFSDVSAGRLISEASCAPNESNRHGRVVDRDGNGIPGISVFLDLGGGGISDENGFFTMRCAYLLAIQGEYDGVCYHGFLDWFPPDEWLTIVTDRRACDPDYFPECC